MSNNDTIARMKVYVVRDNIKHFQNGEDESLCGKQQCQTMSNNFKMARTKVYVLSVYVKQ